MIIESAGRKWEPWGYSLSRIQWRRNRMELDGIRYCQQEVFPHNYEKHWARPTLLDAGTRTRQKPSPEKQ